MFQNGQNPFQSALVTLKTLCNYFLRVACCSSCIDPWFLNNISLCKVRQTDGSPSTVPILSEIAWQPSADYCIIWVFHEISSELLV